MAQNGNQSEKIRNWIVNLQAESDRRLEEVSQHIVSNEIFKDYVEEISKISKEVLQQRFFDFAASCSRPSAGTHKKSAAKTNENTLKKTKVQQCGANTWVSRLREPISQPLESCVRRNVPCSQATMKTPTHSNSKPLMLRTPSGNVRLPRAITPKVQNTGGVKFRTLGREEVAFSIAGTPVVAKNEKSNDSTSIVNELLHANDDELTPQTRKAVQGMRQILGRIHISDE
ncbi:unnamed protein product [Thelazia callipaeda]|uniref:Nbl1_Borealin_N domain-containing protein n=1 Tax=Thelazia callipaeda TaxID=103827 RepID=A0A0N5D4N4_THECL|nr:unnamed protein product [Thelazia callipaeda]